MRSRDYRSRSASSTAVSGHPVARAGHVRHAPLRAAGHGDAGPGRRGGVFLVEKNRRIKVTALCVEQTAHPVEKAARATCSSTGKAGAGECRSSSWARRRRPGKGRSTSGRARPRATNAFTTSGNWQRWGRMASSCVPGAATCWRPAGYRGTAYAVYRLLEQLGWRRYADELEVLPPRALGSPPRWR